MKCFSTPFCSASSKGWTGHGGVFKSPQASTAQNRHDLSSFFASDFNQAPNLHNSRGRCEECNPNEWLALLLALPSQTQSGNKSNPLAQVPLSPLLPSLFSLLLIIALKCLSCSFNFQYLTINYPCKQQFPHFRQIFMKELYDWVPSAACIFCSARTLSGPPESSTKAGSGASLAPPAADSFSWSLSFLYCSLSFLPPVFICWLIWVMQQ